MFRLCLLFLAFAYTYPSKTESARILCIFSMPGKSHQRMFQPLTHELAKRGHEVTVFTHHPSEKNGRNHERLTEIDMIDVAPFDMKKYFDQITASSFHNPLHNDVTFYKTTTKHLEYVKAALTNYSKNHFDLIFLESAIRQFLVFSHIFNAPVIKISCCGAFPHDYPEIGAATHPILYPRITQRKLYNLTNWDKINELIKYYNRQLFVTPELYSLENQQIRAIFGQDIPPIEDLIHNVDMLFLHTHPLWEGNVPVPSNVVHLWGIHLEQSSDLSVVTGFQDVQYLLNSSTNGIVYMSFGSTIKTSWLPKTTIQAIPRTLSRVPYDVLLKWEDDVLPEKPKNVHIRKWWPQAELLRHPNVKLFISHGGLFSTHEAIMGGVPVISIPFFGDQYYNAEKCVHHKIGVKLEYEAITENSFYNAITTVLENDTYRHNIIKLRSLMMDQPESALERAVWWTEYVLRHSGAKHLRSPAANISWAHYYEIEFVFTAICVIIFVFILIGIMLYCFYKCLEHF